VLRNYQIAVMNGECDPNPILESGLWFSRGESVLSFCGKLAELQPMVATHQLRYLLASLCSGNCAEGFEIMVKWSNTDVISEFQRSFGLIQQRAVTIRLEGDGQFSLSNGAKRAIGAFGIPDFIVDQHVLETVATPRELVGKANNLDTLISVKRAFLEDLAAENELLKRLNKIDRLPEKVETVQCQ